MLLSLLKGKLYKFYFKKLQTDIVMNVIYIIFNNIINECLNYLCDW